MEMPFVEHIRDIFVEESRWFLGGGAIVESLFNVSFNIISFFWGWGTELLV